VTGRLWHLAPETLDLTIWYATETRVFRWIKRSWYDAQGVIVTMGEGARFVAQNGRGLEFRRISAIQRLTGSVIPWPAVASLAICHVLFLLLLAISAASNGPTLGCAMVVLVSLGLTDLIVFSTMPMSWVRVDDLNEQNQPCRAYFTVGSAIGRWTGGGQHLFALLQQLTAEKEDT
jgi:hypothetical protein